MFKVNDILPNVASFPRYLQDIRIVSYIKANLERHQAAIDALLSCIPQKYYSTLSDEQQDSIISNKFMKNKKQSSEIKGLAKQAKKAKLDPEKNGASIETSVSSIPVAPLIPTIPIQSVSITELRAKLHAKIALLRSNRKASDSPKSKEDILEKRLGKKKGTPPSAKSGNTNKRKAEDIEGDDSTAVNSEVDDGQKSKQKAISDDVSFGVIDFGNEKKKVGIDTMSKLKKVESERLRIEKIKEKNPEKANSIQDQQKWTKMFSLAQGTKLNDDPKLLKKTLKREQKQKEKSKTAWIDRKETVKKNEEEGQKRRNENLLARKEGRPTKRKINKRPGFEGGRAKKAQKTAK